MNAKARLESIFGWRVAALINGLVDATAYRLEFFTEFFGSAIGPAAIQWVLWYSMFKLSGLQEVGGASYMEMVQYTFASILFSQVRGGNLDFELAEMIRSGALSQHLLKPISVIEFVFIRGVSGKLFIAVFAMILGSAMAIFAPEYFGIQIPRLCAGMTLAIAGNVIHYQVGCILAAMAFYWEEAYSILLVKNMIVKVLCGELVPLSLFPDSMSWAWKYFPFYLYVFGPAQIALGKWDYGKWGESMLIAAAWIVALAILTRLSWRVGIKKYQSLGG